MSDSQLQANKRAQAAERKRKSRANRKRNGIDEIRIELAQVDVERMDYARVTRAIGTGEPYSRTEYIARLIREDAARLKEQISEAKCERCTNPLPEGCAGVCRGESACFHFMFNKGLRLKT
ncbi:hypothetical protein [Pseudoalteromonas ruthenica]|uniref:hypothetical protein n=1 Tax=Pseudoalteromonas ruthenica TaxID=151081 RepID=UPI00110B759C|nr:hypothetical protein [Pseudoalteromonas ruthenica]TMP23765.1 hypothetical protein CWC06_09430 [Pseudoalteromonas ruthenica]